MIMAKPRNPAALDSRDSTDERKEQRMPTEVASTKFGVLIHYDEWNTLELKWLPATKGATEAEARDTMALFAAETEKLKPRFLIVDTTEFLHRWADDMMAWRDKEIIPHYNAGGPEKFAFITGEGVPFPTVESGAHRPLTAPRPSPPGGSPAGTGPTSGWPNNRRARPRVTGARGRRSGIVLQHLLEVATRSPPLITTLDVRETMRGDRDARRLRRYSGWHE
jgi:hypothetical protein